MAWGEKPGREVAIEFRKAATDLREVAARHEEFPPIKKEIIELAEKYEKGAIMGEEDAEEGGQAKAELYEINQRK